MNILSKTYPYKFILFSVLLCIVIFAIENINQRFWLNDLRVYYYATDALLHGKQVYGTAFGLSTGFYKYSPFALLLFIPYTLLPYYVACVIQFAIVSLSFIGAVLVVRKIITRYLLSANVKNENLLLSLIQICVLLHLVRELKLGNVNVLLVLLLSAALLSVLKNRQVSAGILLGIAVMFKPYLLILALPLLFHKKIKTLFALTSTLIASLLLPALIFGPSKNIELHKQWFIAMKEHSNYLFSNHTIASLLRNNIHTELPSGAGYIIFAFVLGAYILLLAYDMMSLNNEATQKRQLIFQYFILLSIIPNLLITDTEQFLYSLPLITIIISHVWVVKRNFYIISFLVVAILLYGINSSDLLGKNLSGIIEEHGLLGIGNLLIIALAIYLYFKPLPLKGSAQNQS